MIVRDERWRAVEELFHRALEVDADRRGQWLEEACGDDYELLREVRSLLAARDAAGDRIEDLVESTAAEVVGTGRRPGLDRPIGPYRLVRELGHGGMGVVYLAERVDGAYRQQVAIKLLQRHLAGAEAHRRLRTERQILAQLDHPAIARLLDGGATEDGTPYLVMEYVDGEPIDAYCRRLGLGIEARIRLFLEVCSAVESAHRRLVVHRDLKPANILVNTEGRAKLLDFGVAKLLDDADQAELTRTAERRLTPGYASPEQVLGEPITTATDVYSLGTVLYELLTGRPAVPATSAASPAQLLDAVCRQDPPRPSTATQQATPADGGRKLSRRLAGDLDAIVMTALRKEPDRRYPSVNALADDLRRHLEGRPVSAHPERWGYVAGKWARRHAASVIAAGLIVLTLIGGFVARTIEAQRANREAATAERISEFLVSLLSEADPEHSRGEELTVLEVVDEGARRVEEELAGDPLIQARLLHAIGQVYKGLGRFEAAERHLRRSLELRRRSGAPGAEVAESLEGLGDLFILRTRLGEAEGMLRRALEIRRGARPRDLAAVSESQTLLGIALMHSGRLDEAETLFRRALEIRHEAYGEEHREVAKSLHNVGWVLQRKGELEAAAEVYERALALKRRLFPSNHPSLVFTLGNLAVARAAQGDHDASLALRREALEITREVFGARHPSYAWAVNEMANQLHDLERFDEAEATYRRALALLEELFPDGSMDTARTINNLASLLEDRGDPVAAEPLFERSLALRRELVGDENPVVAHALHNLGRVLRRLGQIEESAALLRESLEIRRRTLPSGHADIEKTAHLLAEVERELGQPAEAVRGGAAEPVEATSRR